MLLGHLQHAQMHKPDLLWPVKPMQRILLAFFASSKASSGSSRREEAVRILHANVLVVLD